MDRKSLLGYVVLIFVLEGASLLVPSSLASLYTSLVIFLIGLAAIVWQKFLDRGKVVDMGFRLNRNVLIGLAIVAAFVAIQFGLTFWLPVQAGVVQITASDRSPLAASGMPPLATALIFLVVGGTLLFISCLFGEELAFRGYILPKLSRLYGNFWAVVLCSAIFGLWHLPAYFSVYEGGAAEAGWGSVALMLLAHGLSSIPICILYLTTRELYSVSIYHALIDVTQYAIVGNPAMGKASQDAVYRLDVTNEEVMEILGLAWIVAAIPIMIGLCRVGKRFVLRNDVFPPNEKKTN
jgi:membrane protease YdiL (CAAX protease family)